MAIMNSTMFGETQTKPISAHTLPTVKHGGGGMMVSVDFTTSGPGYL